jgi:predicted metal-dependent hydrolase
MNEQLPLFQLPPEKPSQKLRHVQIGPRIVGYELSVGGRRRLTMRIDERGLHVGAPLRTSIADIEKFIRDNGAWVTAKIDEYVGSGVRRQLAMRDGQRVPLLGGEAEVRVIAGGNRVRWEGDVLVLAAKPDADLDALARRALQRRALEVFAQRVDVYAPRLGRKIPPLGLSSARTRWGSCSSTGIRLNWRLIHLPLHLIDYVVAHELGHLVEMNHSPRFWAVVESLYPNCRAARKELKQRTPELPII